MVYSTGLFFFFFWPRHVARGILVPRPGMEHVPPALGARSFNHWTAREVPHQASCPTVPQTSCGPAAESLLPQARQPECAEWLLLGQGKGLHGPAGSLGTKETKKLKKRGPQGTSTVGELDLGLLSFIWCLYVCLCK